METICINLKIRDYNILANACKVSDKNKRDIIVAAINWQFDHLDDTCITYVPGKRRTANIRLDEVELDNLNQLAEYMNTSPAQAALISARNFINAYNENAHDYFKNDGPDIPERFVISLYPILRDVLPSFGKINAIREAIRSCANQDDLPQVQARTSGVKAVPVGLILNKKEDRQILGELNGKI